uniref:IRG-type G domain-containing protein n=1 Tax=Pyrodinium bahamense TaxID=73915 RepID=A0A7S0A0E9_9DINO
MAEDQGTAPLFLLQGDFARTVNIAVAGNSGVGKSLLVNTLRGVNSNDPTWAPVGVTETTREPTWYEFPGQPKARLWDMEGAGGHCSWDNYMGSVGLWYFDLVLVLCSSRVTECDMDIVRELESKSIPFFFVRTKLDEDVKNNRADYDMTAEETAESIRCTLQSSRITNPYLINARRADQHDFPRLIRDIVIRLGILEENLGRKVSTAAGNATPRQAANVSAVEVRVSASGSEAALVAAGTEAATPRAATAPTATPSAARAVALVPLEGPVAKEAASPGVGHAGEECSSGRAEAVFDPAAPEKLSGEGPTAFPQYCPPNGQAIEPIEALHSDGGHWVWLADDGLYEYFEAETGAVLAYLMTKMSGIPEHIFVRRSDGVWECKVKNLWTGFGSAVTGKDNHVVTINPNNKESSMQLQIVWTRKFIGTSVEYIEGGRLITEQRSKAWKRDGSREKGYAFRATRLVTNGQYWIVFENLLQGTRGIRRFKRYPFYRIANETEQKVTMKTYPVAAFFASPNSTVVLEPGTQCVDCHRGDVTVEQEGVFHLM